MSNSHFCPYPRSSQHANDTAVASFALGVLHGLVRDGGDTIGTLKVLNFQPGGATPADIANLRDITSLIAIGEPVSLKAQRNDEK